MGYIDEDCMVRVEIFKDNGKWMQTEAVKWLTWNGPGSAVDGKGLCKAFEEALRNHFGDSYNNIKDCIAICADPYHEHAHPIMLKIGDEIVERDWTVRCVEEGNEIFSEHGYLFMIFNEKDEFIGAFPSRHDSEHVVNCVNLVGIKKPNECVVLSKKELGNAFSSAMLKSKIEDLETRINKAKVELTRTDISRTGMISNAFKIL